MAATEITTDLTIKNLKLPSSGRLDFKVRNSRGLYLRASQSNKVWYLRARPPGSKNPVAIKIGPYGTGQLGYTLKSAKAKAEEWREDIASGKDPRKANAILKKSLYESVVEEFLSRGKTKLNEPWSASTAKGYRLTLNSSRLRHWRALPVANITADMVQDIIHEIESEGLYTTARRTLAYLKAFFCWCQRRKQNYIPSSILPPTFDIELEAPKDNQRERHLSPNEIRIFWKATERLEYPWRQYYQLALLTGQRVGNITHIKRADIKNGTWLQQHNKAKRPVLIPINELAQQAIDSCPEVSRYLLSTTGDKPISPPSKDIIENHIQKLISTEKLQGVFEESWVAHDLRRTFTTQAAYLKIPEQIYDKILNHAPKTVSQKHYNQYDFFDEKIKAMTTWSNYVKDLTSNIPQRPMRITNAR